MLIVLAGFLVAVALLTGRTGATDRYHTIYSNVAGVTFGTQVLFEGYPVGQVERVVPLTDGGDIRFRVEMSIEEGFPIPEDSTAAIASTGLLAGVSVQIRRGESDENLEPGSLISAGASTDVFAAVSRVAGEINRLNDEGLVPLMDKLNRYVDVFGRMLTKRTPRLLDDLESVTDELAGSAPQATDNLEAFTRQLSDGVTSPENLARLRRTLANIEAASQNLNEGVFGQANREQIEATLANMRRFSEEFLGMARQLRRSEEKIDALIRSLDETVTENRGSLRQGVEDLRYTLQVVAEHIDAISYNLEGTSRNMHEFAREIRQNPGLLLGGREPAGEE